MANTPIAVTPFGTFDVFNQPSGSNDRAVWRLEDATLPPMFRATIIQDAKENKTGTNVNCTVKVSIPITYTDVAGRIASQDTVIASASVTSLQNVTGTQVGNAIDSLIKALTSQKASIVAGKTAI